MISERTDSIICGKWSAPVIGGLAFFCISGSKCGNISRTPLSVLTLYAILKTQLGREIMV